jgi:hypothetical protein
MKWFNTLARWIVVSSADPSEVALTIKGVLVGLVPYAISAAGLAHLNVGSDQINAIISGLATVVQDVLAAISAIMMFYGMVRKLWITIHTHQQVVTAKTTTTPPQA